MSHSDPTIPSAVIKAAKRGFVRATAQAYSAALAGGISAAVIITAIQGGPNLLALGITAGVAVVSPLLAGAASYLSIIAKGVPDAYAEGAVASVDDPAGLASQYLAEVNRRDGFER